jgi:hypothetical protein
LPGGSSAGSDFEVPGAADRVADIAGEAIGGHDAEPDSGDDGDAGSLGALVQFIQGAEQVIKIEPPAGDLSRRAFPGHGEISGYYAQQNAGKRNVSIDLNVPGARDIALRLCHDADVIIENFRPGALAAFGLDYETISRTNLRVVYVSISGYGQHGSWRSRSAYAPTVQAETGITATTAARSWAPPTARSSPGRTGSGSPAR